MDTTRVANIGAGSLVAARTVYLLAPRELVNERTPVLALPAITSVAASAGAVPACNPATADLIDATSGSFPTRHLINGTPARIAVVVVGAVIGLFVAYCALLATYAVWRDFTLTGVQKVLRTVYVWLVPVVGPMLYLRSAAELAPNAVPSRRWLWPVRWLFYVKPSTISCTPEDAADVTLEQFNQRGF